LRFNGNHNFIRIVSAPDWRVLVDPLVFGKVPHSAEPAVKTGLKAERPEGFLEV